MNKFLKFFNLKNVFVLKLCVNIHYTCMNCRQMHMHRQCIQFQCSLIQSLSPFCVSSPFAQHLFTLCSVCVHHSLNLHSSFSFCSLLCSVRADCLESNQRFLILSSVWAQLSFTARSPFMFFNLHCHSELWSRKIILENRKTKMSMCSL